MHPVAVIAQHRARQLEIRDALLANGYQVIPLIDYKDLPGDLFSPRGVVDVPTNELGFDRDGDMRAGRRPAPDDQARKTCPRALVAPRADRGLERALGPETDACAPVRVAQAQFLGVQHQTREIARGPSSVKRIAQNRVANFKHMDTQLV